MDSVLFDTNIVIAHINGTDRISNYDVDVYLSTVSVFEILRLSGISRAEETDAHRFIKQCEVVSVTEQIAKRAAFMGRTRCTGPIDLLIAATALELGVPLVTKNVKDFRDIKGLMVLAAI